MIISLKAGQEHIQTFNVPISSIRLSNKGNGTVYVKPHKTVTLADTSDNTEIILPYQTKDIDFWDITELHFISDKDTVIHIIERNLKVINKATLQANTEVIFDFVDYASGFSILNSTNDNIFFAVNRPAEVYTDYCIMVPPGSGFDVSTPCRYVNVIGNGSGLVQVIAKK